MHKVPSAAEEMDDRLVPDDPLIPNIPEPDFEAEHSLEPEDVRGYNWAADRLSADTDRREGAREWAAVLAERGWIAPHWPKEYGGAGLSAKQEFILQEEMMRARVPTVNPVLVSTSKIVRFTDAASLS